MTASDPALTFWMSGIAQCSIKRSDALFSSKIFGKKPESSFVCAVCAKLVAVEIADVGVVNTAIGRSQHRIVRCITLVKRRLLGTAGIDFEYFFGSSAGESLILSLKNHVSNLTRTDFSSIQEIANSNRLILISIKAADLDGSDCRFSPRTEKVLVDLLSSPVCHCGLCDGLAPLLQEMTASRYFQWFGATSDYFLQCPHGVRWNYRVCHTDRHKGFTAPFF